MAEAKGMPQQARGWRLMRMHLMERRARLRGWLLEDGATRGLGGPPNNWQMSREHRGGWGHSGGVRYRAAFLNDAGEIGISVHYDGEDERWGLMLPATTFRRLALWYLWRWAYGEWFGLRRRLFYRDNHRRVERMMRGRGPS